jgi:hypothetical protein
MRGLKKPSKHLKIIFKTAYDIDFIRDVYLFLLRDLPEDKKNSISLGTPYGGATSACGG